MRSLGLSAVALLSVSCVHPLVASDLARVKRPALVAWVEEGAGPTSEVFRQDASQLPRIKKLEAREADRRLAAKLQQGVSSFEVADRLRASTMTRLPQAPWTSAVNPAQVASLFGSFLVEEVPTLRPDVNELRQLGADAVLEFQVKEFGMRSAKGKAGVFVAGDARMFFLGGHEIWHAPFRVDQVTDHTATLDPLEVSHDVNLFKEQLVAVLEKAGEWAANELTPHARKGTAPAVPGEKPAPADDAPPPGELE